ncbi:MAG: ABC transporter permease [Acidilobaceae archaeon]|nr:ABC transporter permease [Acidilobaceae archaeon]MDW7974016.1 ABC transporter permease [Sulfolobales archaeon]
MKRALQIYSFLAMIVIYVPVALMVLNSFNENPYMDRFSGPSLRWFETLLGDEEAKVGYVNSFTVAVVSSILSVLLAFAAASSLSGRRVSLIDALAYPPIVIPEIAEAVALFMFFQVLGAELGWLTVVIGHTAFNVAFAYLTLRTTGTRFEALENAARTLGASRLQVFKDIVLPLALPSIVVAMAITFLLSFTNFMKTLFTTGPGFYTLPLLIWNRARRPGVEEFSYPNALNALFTPLVLITLSIAVTYTLYVLTRQKRE